MAQGGMYDHLGGGFHRYSTDDQWLVPHFEKMLYDNALLAWTYLEAYQVTGKEMYSDIVHGILNYVLREMTDEQGGFYSAQDAGEIGEEGIYYLWSKEELKQHQKGSRKPWLSIIVPPYAHQTPPLNTHAHTHTIREASL